MTFPCLTPCPPHSILQEFTSLLSNVSVLLLLWLLFIDNCHCSQEPQSDGRLSRSDCDWWEWQGGSRLRSSSPRDKSRQRPRCSAVETAWVLASSSHQLWQVVSQLRWPGHCQESSQLWIRRKVSVPFPVLCCYETALLGVGLKCFNKTPL